MMKISLNSHRLQGGEWEDLSHEALNLFRCDLNCSGFGVLWVGKKVRGMRGYLNLPMNGGL